MANPKAGEDFFKAFVHSQDLTHILDDFRELCAAYRAKPQGPHAIYNCLKSHLEGPEAVALFKLLHKRMQQPPYDKGKACLGYTGLVVGAGPCGLRMAIEMALLGMRVVVVEKRDYVSRNNVLHMWPFVIHDLKLLGAKIFYPRFCVGNREHINTSRLQQILLKIALILGVEVHTPITCQKLSEPTNKLMGKNKGWRVQVSPSGHRVETIDFDAIVAADGHENSLGVFQRKVFRGQTALGITANFMNKNEQADAEIDEIGGLFKVFNPAFFNRLKSASIDLENFVYFKNDTHYFVMTAKKASLLEKKVFRQDEPKLADLLAPKNINQEMLIAYTRETTNIATEGKMKAREFTLNHQSKPDVSLFNFTAFHKAQNSCMAAERHGRKLLLSVIGDALMEPFWPTGTGVARGFLSTFDTAWLIRQWFSGDVSSLATLAEKETLYSVLSQTSPEKLAKNLSTYTIDPSTRYGPQLVMRTHKEADVKVLFRKKPLADWPAVKEVEIPDQPAGPTFRRGSLQNSSQAEDLLEWYAAQLASMATYVDPGELIHAKQWADGMAICALLSKYRPELMDISKVDPANALTNVTKAFSLIESEYGVSPFVSPVEMVSEQAIDKLALLSFLAQLKFAILEDEALAAKQQSKKKGVFGRRMSAIGMLMKVSKKDKSKSKNTIRRGEAKRMEEANQREGEQPSEDKEQAILSGGRRMSQSAICSICGDSLYVAERQTAHGYFFHKHCFKCSECRDQLWVTHAVPKEEEDGKVTFSCPWHDHIGIVSSPVLEKQMAIIEEDSSEEDETPPELPPRKYDMTLEQFAEEEGDFSTEHLKSLRRYSLHSSVQLMEAHTLQQEMSQAEQEEAELAEVGRQIEQDIRGRPALGANKEANNRLTAEFLQVMEEKHKVKRRQMNLQLRKKMFDLRNTQNQLLEEMEAAEDDVKMAKMKREIGEVQKMAGELQAYLAEGEE